MEPAQPAASSRVGGRWPAIPAEVAEQIRPVLPAVAEEMIAEVLASVAEYVRPGDGGYARGIRRGVEQAVGLFVAQIADPGTPRDQLADVFRAIGRGEAAEGRSLEPLQVALRAGARVVMRRLTETSQRVGARPETLGLLAEALFVYLDEIAALSAVGYAEARALAAGEVDRLRRRLMGLLLAERPPAESVISELAHLAQWRSPRTIAAVVLAAGPGDAGIHLHRMPAEVLMDLHHAQPRLLVPDPDGPGRRKMLDHALDGFLAAVGPTVSVPEAAKSLRWAQEALGLAQRGVFGDTSIVRCDDHLTELALQRGADFIERLTELRLAALAGMAPQRRDVLADTLLAWIQLGKNSDVAARLHVHPQTIRYRLGRLHELFGEQLYDVNTRFELEVVLRARAGTPVSGNRERGGHRC